MAAPNSRQKSRQQRRVPRQARARATASFVLDAAAQVFAERGYAATTNEIAARAGVSIGSLYQYFADKDALLVALAERHLAADTPEDEHARVEDVATRATATLAAHTS